MTLCQNRLHEMTEENTQVFSHPKPGRRPYRECVACRKAKLVRQAAALKAKKERQPAPPDIPEETPFDPELLPTFIVQAEPWMADKNCKDVDINVFFPGKGGTPHRAKFFCAACSVRSECLDYALRTKERYGVWGGMSERERRKLVREVDDARAAS